MAMSAKRVGLRVSLGTALLALATITGGCATYHSMMGKTELSGANESPPVSTQASGLASIKVGSDGSVSGEVTVSGMVPTAAHIHHGAAGKNGPVIIPLKKTGADSFEVPAGAKFTEAQLAEYKAGEMYVNVHSAEHKPGEVRGQLKP
jgi:CHRD domain